MSIISLKIKQKKNSRITRIALYKAESGTCNWDLKNPLHGSSVLRKIMIQTTSEIGDLDEIIDLTKNL
jgi:hypothetical protein